MKRTRKIIIGKTMTKAINNNFYQGFTLIEMLIVVAVIAILATIAYPSYQQYVIKSKRSEAMTEIQNIANQLESQKMAKGKYSEVNVGVLKTDFDSKYPSYTLAISPNPLTSEWAITATPIVGKKMDGDGDLSLNFNGIKCRVLSTSDKRCGTGDAWKN